ncbi:MAG: hypothetical protein K9K79_01180 [Desulfohalobiaceae bacterium]|nr:hypothetical protein [Desulfohalobiaceae bacterium]
MKAFVIVRDFLIFILGTWFFQFHTRYTFPEEDNLLLYFVAIPVIWSTLIHIWTATSYKEQKNLFMTVFTHVMAILLLISTIFIISATLNTIAKTLDPFGIIFFHFVGWTVILSLIFYDIVDMYR